METMMQKMEAVVDLIVYETMQAFRDGLGVKYTFGDKREACRLADEWCDKGQYIGIYDLNYRYV